MNYINQKLAVGLVAVACAALALPALAQDATSGSKTTDRPMSEATHDTWITTKVKTDLLATKGVSGTDVKVDTKDGVVTLTGHVATQAEADKAKAVAKSVKGVKDVNSKLVIKAPKG